jgi:hypothetical protein
MDLLPLSVVVASRQTWPFTRECLDHLCPQADAAGAEIILADGSGVGLSEEYVGQHPCVRWMNMPGASVFDLRARAVAVARGEVVALTEDHCVVTPTGASEFSRHIEGIHRCWLSAGPSNGSTRLLIDKANFFLTFGPFMPPFASNLTHGVPPPANVSTKRSTFLDVVTSPGWIEFALNPSLCAQGAVAFDDNLRVNHIQSHGFWGTCASHFHNGRSTTGLVSAIMAPKRQHERLWLCLKKPIAMVRETITSLSEKQMPRRHIIGSIPLVTLLAVCHVAGEVTGLIKGPGESPWRLS